MALKRTGALWKKTDKNGKEYLAGQIDFGALGVSAIMIFENTYKEKENQPDYTLHIVNDIVPDEEAPPDAPF